MQMTQLMDKPTWFTLSIVITKVMNRIEQNNFYMDNYMQTEELNQTIRSKTPSNRKCGRINPPEQNS